MATPKHILRIHDTEANLIASLKDQQIAWATDINEAIWRNGTDFHYLASGKYFDGVNYIYDGIDAESLTLHDNAGNSKSVTYASLLAQTYEVLTTSDLREALEANQDYKTLIINRDVFNFINNQTFNVYGANYIISSGTNFIWTSASGVNIVFDTSIGGAIIHTTPEVVFGSFGSSINYQINGIGFYTRGFSTATGATISGTGGLFYEKDLGADFTNISVSLSKGFWDNTIRTAEDLPYDNTTSGLTATEVQGAIDELSAVSTPSTQIESTGIKQGSAISVNGGDNTKWDLASGQAYIMDYSNPSNIKSKLVTWTAQSALSVTNLLTDVRTNVAIALDNSASTGVSFTNSFTGTIDGVSGTIYIAEKVTNFDSEQLRKFALVGRLVHTNQTNLSFVVPLQRHTESVLSSVLDFIDLFPAINVEGNEFSGKAGVLQVAKSAGKGFRFGSNYETNLQDPNIQDIPSADPTTHAYRYQDGAGGFTQATSSTFIDPTKYDDGSGTLQNVSNNQWTAQPVFVFAGSGSMFIQYGQNVFASKDGAIESLATASPVLDQNLVDDAIFRGWFIVRGGASDLSDSGDFQWKPPLSERSSGTGQALVVDLQGAYNNSLDPEITTDSTRGGLTLKRGSALDTDCVIEVQNGAGTQTFCVDGNGDVTSNNLVDKTSAQTITGAKTFDNDIAVTGNTSLTGLGKQLIGGFGAVTLGGTLDWNASTNARSGNGASLLSNTSSNRPQLNGDNFWHPFSFEYNDKDGTGNLTQFAIPYRVGNGGKMALRSRFSSSWSDWAEVMSSKPSSTERVYNFPTSTNSIPTNGDIWFDGTNLKGREGGATFNLNGGGGGGVTYQSSTNVANIASGSALSGSYFATKFIPEGDIDVNYFTYYVTSASGGSTVYCGLYNSAGTTLLGEASGSGATAGYTTTSATSSTISLTGGAEYWLVVLEGAGAVNLGSNTAYSDSGLNRSAFVSSTPTGMPSSISAGTATTTRFYIGVKTNA